MRKGLYGLSSECRKCRRFRSKKWNAANPLSGVRSRLRFRFGLTLEQYQEMFDAQNGLCAICGQPSSKKMLGVDHDHETGAIRQLLCHNCNVVIGLARENVTVLANAIQYLTKHRS